MAKNLLAKCFKNSKQILKGSESGRKRKEVEVEASFKQELRNGSFCNNVNLVSHVNFIALDFKTKLHSSK